MAKIKNTSLNDLISETKKHLKGEPKKGLTEKDFKIVKGQSFDDFAKKYGNKSISSVKAFKKSDMGYMKKGKKYYELKEGAYISTPNFFLPILFWIPAHKVASGAIAAAVVAGGVVGGLAAGGVFKSKVPLKKWYEYPESGEDFAWWDVCSYGGEYQATEDDIGQTVKVTLNGTEHEVRLIGVDHLEPGESSAQAHCTFEFVNLISDENGYSLATYWQDTATMDGSNNNYLDSSIRSALNGKYNSDTDGSTKYINWFQYFGSGEDTAVTGKNRKFSQDYSDYSNGAQINKGKSVLSMLPDGLASTVKQVTKKVNTYEGSRSETDCTDKLFLLSPLEMGYASSNTETGVTTYKYYEGHTQQTEAIRIKQQVKGADGARTSTLSGDDLDGDYSDYSSKKSWAGYNSGTTGNGGYSWLRSPCTSHSNDAWTVDDGGFLDSYYACNRAFAVAPAFCI